MLENFGKQKKKSALLFQALLLKLGLKSILVDLTCKLRFIVDCNVFVEEQFKTELMDKTVSLLPLYVVSWTL